MREPLHKVQLSSWSLPPTRATVERVPSPWFCGKLHVASHRRHAHTILLLLEVLISENIQVYLLVRMAKAPAGCLAALCLVVSLLAVQAKGGHETCFVMRFEDRNMEAVAAAVIDIASISSSKAGKWLSADAVAEMTGRTEVEIQQLKDYIESQQGRLVQVSPTRQVLLGAVEQQWQQDCN